MILRADGSVWSTPISFRGDMNPPMGIDRHFAQLIPNGATAVAAGSGYSLVLKQDYSLWAMGRNYHGQHGDGTMMRKTTFTYVKTIPGAKVVTAGGGHSIILTHQGSVLSTGRNTYGQLGDASTAYTTNFL